MASGSTNPLCTEYQVMDWLMKAPQPLMTRKVNKPFSRSRRRVWRRSENVQELLAR